MRAVIVGCGRVGATMARALETGGHDVTIVDLVTKAFDRLPAAFRGNAVRGDGTDEDTLRRAGAEGADLFLALTEGDNRNIMAAQLAREALGIERVYAKVNDPVRAQAYAELGIGTDLPDDDDGRRACWTPSASRWGRSRRSARRRAPVPMPARSPARRPERCSCWSWGAARSATT